MKRFTFAALAIGIGLWLSNASLMDQRHHASAEDMTGHGGDHGVFRPDQIKWMAGPPSLPPGAQFAVLEGDMSKEGYFAARLKLPDGYKIPPHWHSNSERLTIISGTFHLGMGETFDQSKGGALVVGTYAFMPPKMKHYAWAQGETVVQITSIGPWDINYINPADDPRTKQE